MQVYLPPCFKSTEAKEMLGILFSNVVVTLESSSISDFESFIHLMEIGAEPLTTPWSFATFPSTTVELSILFEKIGGSETISVLLNVSGYQGS